MLNILKRFCNDSSIDNGLMLIDMPTGSGKTYFVIEYIFNHFEKFAEEGKKIFFITSLKKNLPIQQLYKYFQDNGRDDFNKHVLFLDSNADCLINNFDKVKSNIPSEFKDVDLFRRINDNIQTINIYKKRLDGKLQDGSKEEDFEGLYFLAQKAKESISEELEPQFRRLIEAKISIDGEGKRRTKAQKKALLKTELQWLPQLYEAVNTDDATVIFLSLDKFLARNSTIVEPSYVVANSNILKNSIVFIDEFDACKEIILKNNIDNGIRDKVSLLSLFRLIHAGLKNTFTSKLLKLSTRLSEEIECNKRKKTPEELFENLKKISEEIYEDYSINYFHKLKDVEYKTNFLFQDFKFLTIFDEKNYEKNKPQKEISIEKSDEEKLNLISIIEAKEDKSDEDCNLYMLLKRLRSFIEYFAKGIGFIALNYKNIKNNEFIDYNYEAAIRTVLAECNIDGKNANYLVNIILNSKKGRITELSDLKIDFDNSIYQKGLRYYSLMDADEFDTQSKIDMVDCSESPEKFLIKLSSNAKVVGISATATLPTVTGNFNINYLKEKLGHRFVELTEDEILSIKNYFEKEIIPDYNNVDIRIQPIDVNEVNYSEVFKNLFPDEKVSQEVLFQLKDLVGDVEYKKIRYIKVFLTMKHFLVNDTVKSFLCLMNIKAANHKRDFELGFLKNVFEILKQQNYQLSNKCYVKTLDGNLDAFESKKKKIHNELKRGNKIFVLSTYQTLGAGQNLQYQMPDDFYDFVKVNDLSYSNKELKDFDGLYLDIPTNIFINFGHALSECEFIRFLYYIKFLQHAGQIKALDANILIRRGFNIFKKSQGRNIKTPECRSIDLHYSRIILQAVGRICRSGLKNKEIFICYDEKIMRYLSNIADEYDSRLLNPEFKALLERAGKKDTYKDSKMQEAVNAAESIATANFMSIDTMINNAQRFGWTFATKENWQMLREFVLKHPAVSDDNESKAYSIYVRLPQKAKGYFYDYDKNNKYYRIGFNSKIDNAETFVGEKMCRLSELMAIPDVKEYFISKGYATQFELSDYILSPMMFTNVYKGALGEVIGKFLIEKYGIVNELKEIEELDKFEKFDYHYKDVYFDFKHWDDAFSYKDNEKEMDRIAAKLVACGGRKAVVINILSNTQEYEIYSKGNVLVVPYLYNLSTKQISIENFHIIKEFIAEYE